VDHGDRSGGHHRGNVLDGHGRRYPKLVRTVVVTGQRGSVRLATWNVKSIKQLGPRRSSHGWICKSSSPTTDSQSCCGKQLVSRGYEVAKYGEMEWNRVAILSRVGLDEVVRGVAGAPGFPNTEARAVSAICGGIRVHSVYVPNGRVPDSDHYRYKLDWLAALAEWSHHRPAPPCVESACRRAAGAELPAMPARSH
jgi:exodeoxyribonuclease-3